MISVQKTEVFGASGYSISNGKVMLEVVCGVGPRIMYFGTEKSGNILKQNQMDFFNRSAGFKFYGGHRLWTSPECDVRNYVPDNGKCDVEVLNLGVKVSVKDEFNRLVKTLDIQMKDNGKVRIIHKIESYNPFEVQLALWGITMLNAGGVEVLPLKRDETGLLPNKTLAVWSYANLGDSRLSFSKNYMFLKGEQEGEPFKLGTLNTFGKAGYFYNNCLFVKEFDVEDGEFPDFGCNYETYTKGGMLEIESLSAMKVLANNESAEHVEVWEIIDDVPFKNYSDKELDTLLNIED